MREEIVGQVRAVQAAMAQAAEPYFGEWYLDDLRCVVRLTVEFYYFLQDWESVSGSISNSGMRGNRSSREWTRFAV